MLRADINFNAAFKLPEALAQQISRVAGWQEMAGPYSRGRSGLIAPLKDPVPVRVPAGTFWLRAIKIKGLGDYSDHLRPKTPQPVPHQGWASVFWQVDPKGNISAVRPFPLFKGGLEVGKAKNEFVLSQQALSSGMVASLPLGWGIYPDIKYQDQQAGFVILGLDEPRDRRWGRLMKSGDLSDRGKLSINPDLEGIVIKEMAQRKLPHHDGSVKIVGCELFAKWGRSLRRLHDCGIIHKVPHDENYSISRLDSGLLADHLMPHDLDLSFTTSGLSAAQNFLYRLIDLAYLMRSVNAMSLMPFGMFINLDEKEGFSGSTYRAVFRGYFGAEAVETEKDSLAELISMIMKANKDLLLVESGDRSGQEDDSPLAMDPRHAKLDLLIQYLSLAGLYDALTLITSPLGLKPPYSLAALVKQIENLTAEAVRAQKDQRPEGPVGWLKSKFGLSG